MVKRRRCSYGTLTTISESPTKVWFGLYRTDDGNIHVTKDGGYSWEQLNQTAVADVKSKSQK
jgi:photosystem II stability/assembly factor-like uncharacterized protein